MSEPLDEALIVRTANKNDMFGWLLMRKKLWPDCSSEEHKEEIRAALDDAENLPVFVAEQIDGNLVGFLEASIHRNEPHSITERVLYIEGWFVEAGFRKQQVGKRLMAFAEAWGKKNGFTEIFSDATLENHISHQAHTNLGFHEVGRNEKNFFFKKDL